MYAQSGQEGKNRKCYKQTDRGGKGRDIWFVLASILQVCSQSLDQSRIGRFHIDSRFWLVDFVRTLWVLMAGSI